MKIFKWGEKVKYKKLKILLFILIIIIGGGLFALTRGLKEGKSLLINNVDISKLSDGTYMGKYSKYRWNSEVEVAVKNHKITKIKLLSDPLTPDVSCELSKKIIDKQKNDVDVVSGATVSSNAYLKSIENALNN
ncbi:FMN-binding protein [Terrisporobacter sp.]